MFVIRWTGLVPGAAKRPFGLAAPERPDHDNESRASRVLGLGAYQRRKSWLQGAIRLGARMLSARAGASRWSSRKPSSGLPSCGVGLFTQHMSNFAIEQAGRKEARCPPRDQCHIAKRYRQYCLVRGGQCDPRTQPRDRPEPKHPPRRTTAREAAVWLRSIFRAEHFMSTPAIGRARSHDSDGEHRQLGA